MRRKDVVDGPGLAAVFGDEPAGFAGDPGKRQGQHGEAQVPGLLGDFIPEGIEEAEDEDEGHGETGADHDAEGPEHRGHGRNRVGGSLLDHFGRGGVDVVRVALQEKTEAEVVAHGEELFAELFVGGILAELFKHADGLLAVDDALLGLGRELLDARNLGGEGAGAHQAEEPGHVDLGVIRLGGFVGDGEERQRSRSLMRFPDGFHGGDLGRLVLRDEVAGFVAHLDGHQGGDHAEDGGEAEGGAGELQVLTAEHVVGGDGHHEDGARHVAAGDGVDELGLSPFVRENGPEVDHFHSHRLEVELSADGIHHPGVGNENPEGGEVGAHGHEDRGGKMLALGEAVPAEEEEADEGGLKEEGHQAFDGERGAEDVAHVVGVVGPVRAELELHGDAGGNAEGEVNPEELAPEAGHVFVDFLAGKDVRHFHGHEHERKSERQGHEDEVVHRGHRKLKAGQVNKIRWDH